MALLLVFVGARLFSGSDAAPGKQDVPGQLTPEEMKALGIAGDTPRDTVATVFSYRQQPTERRANLTLSLLEFGYVIWIICIDFDCYEIGRASCRERV